jgi:hypothetical protein
MVGDRADLLSKKDGYGRNRSLDIDTVSLELLDAFCKELVVVDQWPQISEE